MSNVLPRFFRDTVYIYHGRLCVCLSLAAFRTDPNVTLGEWYGVPRVSSQWQNTYTPCPKKTKQICFCPNLVKFPPILIIFGRKMGNDQNICEVHSFSTSPNLRHHLTVLNANVPNCYITRHHHVPGACLLYTSDAADE